MKLLDANNAADYLRQAGRIGKTEQVSVTELAGGVSNVVLYVARPQSLGRDFVLKQAREQLRTPLPWFCTVERIWREVEVLCLCQSLLENSPQLANHSPELRATTPEVLFEDRENYCFAMSAAPSNHRVWKQDLLQGVVDERIASACGKLLGQLHAQSWLSAEAAQALGDRRLFHDLRIDPYYRTVAQVHPDLRRELERLIDSVWDHATCLVHADFSPKNLLVFDSGLMMVDFETGHFGDPAFDLGFFLSHLLLKARLHAEHQERYFALTRTFLESYHEQLQAVVPALELELLEARAVQNFAGCALARLDGKSRVEYLTEPSDQDAMRRLCRLCFVERLPNWSEVLKRASARQTTGQ